MEEEKKVTDVESTPVEAAPAEEKCEECCCNKEAGEPKHEECCCNKTCQASNEASTNKFALLSFIFSCASIAICSAPFGGEVAGIVLAILGLIWSSKPGVPSRNPHRVFKRIAKPLSIVGIVLNVILLVVYIIVFVAAAVNAATR